MAVPSPKSTVMLVVELRPFGKEKETQSPPPLLFTRLLYLYQINTFQLSGHEQVLGTYRASTKRNFTQAGRQAGPAPEANLLLNNPQNFYHPKKKKIKQVHNILEGLIKKACSQALARGTEVSTSSRKTRKVTFLPRVATSVPSLVRSCKPLGARLGHLCRLGLNLRGAPSVQLFDKALRYLKTSQKKRVNAVYPQGER